MKSLMKKVDLFCYRHPRFGISNLMLYVVIGNVVVWLFSWFAPVTGWLSFSPYHILRGQIWRLVTFIIIPNADGILALIAFYFYYFIGNTLESRWGSGKFTIYFFSGVLLTVIYGFFCYFVFRVNLSVSATYIYFSMFFAFATLFPDLQVLLFFIIPIKMKWLALVDALFFAYEIFSGFAYGSPFVALLPIVALLNYFLFCGGWLFDWLKPGAKQQRKNTMDFKREVRRIQYEQQTKPYSRKCEVCGRTDADFPDLEFRYCSRCQGYHCFCIDHINAHQHFSE